MAVTVTDNRTILYQDGLTNITGASTSVTSFYAEASGCAGEAYNIATGQIYWSGTTPNFTTTGNEMIYIWSAVVATQNGYKEATASNSSHAIYLSDGADDLLIYQAGNDRDVFKHAEGQVSFQCFLIDIDYLDTVNTDGDLAVTAGTYAGFDKTSTSMDVGAHYTTLSKALGGGQNCYLDIIRYGGADEGITVSGGTTGDRGNFQETCAEDRSDLDGKAHGIIREYTGGAYGCQGTIKIGDDGTGTSYFEEDGFSLTFEDRLVADDKYKLVALGNTTGTNVIVMTNATIASARPGVTIDFSDSSIEELTLTTVTFLNLINDITFPTDYLAATRDHEITFCTFNNCGVISPGSSIFTDNVIAGANLTSTEGAVLIDSNSTVGNWSDLDFTKGTSGHAIKITATGTYTFDNFTYSGYSGTGTDATVYNDSGGAVTINVTGGNTPTVRNGTGASTSVVSSVPVTITVQDSAGDAIEGARVFLEEDPGGTDVISYDTTNASGQVTTTYGGTTPQAVTGFVAKGGWSPVYKRAPINDTIGSTGLSATITLIADE
jgi:hypothetical protein